MYCGSQKCTQSAACKVILQPFLSLSWGTMELKYDSHPNSQPFSSQAFRTSWARELIRFLSGPGELSLWIWSISFLITPVLLSHSITYLSSSVLIPHQSWVVARSWMTVLFRAVKCWCLIKSDTTKPNMPLSIQNQLHSPFFRWTHSYYSNKLMSCEKKHTPASTEKKASPQNSANKNECCFYSK